jgi:hypothetical protein
MRPAIDVGTLALEMIARAVDDAADRLRDLRHEEWEEGAVAAAALVLALVATSVRPSLAIPLFLGGVFIAGRWVVASFRRAELLDLLVGDPDAYVIPEVRARAQQEASMDARSSMSRAITWRLQVTESPRIRTTADDLAALATDLLDPELELDPACGVACARLVSDPLTSPLLNDELPADEIRSRVLQVRAGFHPRELSRSRLSARAVHR